MFLPRKTNTTLDKILDLSWRRIPISRPIRRGALSFRVKPFFFFFLSVLECPDFRTTLLDQS